MSGNTYSDFMENNGFSIEARISKIDLSGLSIVDIKSAYFSAKKSNDTEGMYRNLCLAFLYDHKTKHVSSFLAEETPYAVEKLLSSDSGTDLARACILTNGFSTFFIYTVTAERNTAAYLHKECARVSIMQKEYAATVWHGRWAGLITTEIIDADWQKKFYDEAVEFRRDAVKLLNVAAKNAKGDIASQASDAAFAFDFSYRYENPIRTQGTDAALKGRPSVIAKNQ